MRFAPSLVGLPFLLCLNGCEGLGSTPGSAGEAPPPPAEAKAAPGEDEAEAAAPAPYDGPLVRSPRPHPVGGKGASRLSYKISSLSELHALAAEAEAPDWSAKEQGEVAALRDDDLSTTWSCEPTGDARCAVGLRFPAPVTVHAVRLFAGAGPERRTYERHPRPKRIRIHTDEGFIEANLLDDREYDYVVFAQEIRTRTLTVEVLETFGREGPLHVAELEVFGSEGEARPPLALDPTRAFVTFEEGGAWRRRGDTYEPRAGFVRVLGEDRNPVAMPGSAVLGRSGDRFLLIEQLGEATCEGARGTYLLLDRETRVMAPLGEFGGVGADLYRRPDGLGLARGYTNEHTTILYGVSFEEGTYRRRQTPLRADKRADDTFASWGFEPVAVPRGGLSLGDAASECQPATLEALAELRQGKKPLKLAGGAEAWHVCPLGEARLLLSTRGSCGSGFELVLVGADHQRIAQKSGRLSRAALRLRRLGPDRMLVEATGGNEQATLFDVRPDAIDVLAEDAALVAPAPSGCRGEECRLEFPNPLAPTWG